MLESDYLLKKIQGNLSGKEELLFQQWLQDSEENKELFEQFFLQDERGMDFRTFSEMDVEAAWSLVLQKARKIKKRQKNKALFTSCLKYAAVLVLFAGLGYFYFDYPAAEQIEDVITLQLNDGSIQYITSNGEKVITDKSGNLVVKQNGERLDYKNVDLLTTPDQNLKGVSFNQLTVPYGKKFELVLSDGTQVYLNAGTSLRYPVKFREGKTREVFLNGEAFFDVTNNKERPFIINVNDLNVRVLGTKFNISSYAEDENITTVLVEGSVGLYSKGENYNKKTSHILEPNHKAAFNKAKKEITTEKVDTDIHTAWKDGRLLFKNSPFENIRKKLERHYNVTITNNYKFLDKQVFTATFDIENITEVLASFNEDTPFDHELKDGRILINKPNINVGTMK